MVGSKKKMKTCTFKLNIRGNKILLSTVFIEKFVCDVTDGYA